MRQTAQSVWALTPLYRTAAKGFVITNNVLYKIQYLPIFVFYLIQLNRNGHPVFKGLVQ